MTQVLCPMVNDAMDYLKVAPIDGPNDGDDILSDPVVETTKNDSGISMSVVPFSENGTGELLGESVPVKEVKVPFSETDDNTSEILGKSVPVEEVVGTVIATAPIDRTNDAVQ